MDATPYHIENDHKNGAVALNGAAALLREPTHLSASMTIDY